MPIVRDGVDSKEFTTLQKMRVPKSSEVNGPIVRVGPVSPANMTPFLYHDILAGGFPSTNEHVSVKESPTE